MKNSSTKDICSLLRWLLIVAAGMSSPAAAAAQDAEHLQELLYGEALFYSHQQDYLSAITRLQLIEEQGLSTQLSTDARLLLARMKLAYGLHVDAGFDFHALLGADVPDAVRNRAWYELARTFSHKGYHEAAAEALKQVQGVVPADIAGDYQLLHATVLMSLDQNLQAAQVLEPWQGAPALAAFAHYNRGIALVRAGDHAQAVPALEMAVGMPAKGEELLALRDKARLSLGYAFARTEKYEQAREQLEAVRPQGPFSSRALLALGWIAHKQGRSESALVSWMELRGRSPTDPAVLETLLVVPAVHRELDALQLATRDYEQAMSAYTSELNHLHEARKSVRNGNTVSLLLQDATGSGRGIPGQPGSGETRYLGSLLASRNFLEMMQGHSELQSMLHNVDKGLHDIDLLASAATPAVAAHARSGAALSPEPAGREAAGSINGNSPVRPQQQGLARPGDDRDWQQQWEYREGEPTDYPAPEIPLLPEIELPANRALQPLPDPEFTGLPESEFSGLPPEPEYTTNLPDPQVTGLPVSEILRYPETGRFRMPSGDLEDYAYPDMVARKHSRPGERYAYQLNRLIPSSGNVAGFNPGAVPVGEALRELAAALNSATDRMAQLGDLYDPAAEIAGLEERIAALRARILQLRARIENAIALYKSYTQALALNELDRRQQLLEDLLEQASLELAKTYDKSSDH
ncbi:MAG: tetratricopeptide repeat protein [Gammaproteobacteria bacterium]